MEVNKIYPVAEVAILTQNRPDHISERAKEGDIITSRKAHYTIGTKERTNYLWLRIEGLEDEFMRQLTDLNFDGNSARYNKRRFSIPLHRLVEVFPSFDINRARDIADEYQPFMILDEDTGRYLVPVKPFQVSGLVFDKTLGVYL